MQKFFLRDLLITFSWVPTPPAKSWIFFLKISGPQKSWKITLSWKVLEILLKVLESPGKVSLKVRAFF